ncbi:MAG: L-arabinose isomerase [Bacteroidetes bacterium]|nr:MAG: L-arabinose isomerase [Bacteroidota bacterium]
MIAKEWEIWLLTGSQHLYGKKTLDEVASDAELIANSLNKSEGMPVRIIHRSVLTTAEEILQSCKEANHNKSCIGIITWMHTFSPAKMWINGLKILHKPILHLHTQFRRDIPWAGIDMDYMNLHQSAHGDREFGHLMSRMQVERKVVVGHWQDTETINEISTWARAAAGWNDWQGAKFVRFGDNMRNVAVTEGDKVSAEYQFGYSVNTHGVSELVKRIEEVSDGDSEALVKEYEDLYQLGEGLKKGQPHRQSLAEAARIELGMKFFLEEGNYKGFTDTFEDLHGLKQLPGIAVQRLMQAGYGFGAEGDWKTAALVRAMKTMSYGLPGGNSFMEDYTYHLEPGHEMVLGAHMLEICPSIACEKPSCEIHPLSIGGKSDPVRLVFDSGPGPAINASLLDMGNRFRLLVNEVMAIAPSHPLPNLPVARVMWQPYPDLKKACHAWILAGGAHHTCYSQNLRSKHMEDFASMAGIEFVLIDKNTDIYQFKNHLRLNEVYYQINRSF